MRPRLDPLPAERRSEDEAQRQAGADLRHRAGAVLRRGHVGRDREGDAEAAGGEAGEQAYEDQARGRHAGGGRGAERAGQGEAPQQHRPPAESVRQAADARAGEQLADRERRQREPDLRGVGADREAVLRHDREERAEAGHAGEVHQRDREQGASAQRGGLRTGGVGGGIQAR